MSWKQVRPILDCLCQIFSSYGFAPINANELYRAKFDRNEVVRRTHRVNIVRPFVRLDATVVEINLSVVAFPSRSFGSTSFGEDFR